MTTWEVMLTFSLVIGLAGLAALYASWFRQMHRQTTRVGPTYWGVYEQSPTDDAADMRLIEVKK